MMSPLPGQTHTSLMSASPGSMLVTPSPLSASHTCQPGGGGGAGRAKEETTNVWHQYREVGQRLSQYHLPRNFF